ncbi:SET domain and MYND-type zinc finger protein 6 [Golovinomyces cichoracearum]|uniref:SET domain and MYND-type zinc finger protein 6 n=1 Tax=Golovinomyces cichoracearum TaxID=62708 RepID=A0A420IKF1_9PEZI|nr:SET domain and MYND-type zinc finger protein 6 [Golovinomyces cichoracearum]
MAQIDLTIKIQTNDRGKGLAAAQDVVANSVLIKVPNPYILLSDKASLSKICSWCMLPMCSFAPHLQPRCVTALKRCSACKIPQYCSSACQRADWKSIHAKECAHLKLLPDIPPTPVRAVMQVLLKILPGSTWETRCANLEGHEADRKKRFNSGSGESWGDFLLQARAATAFSGMEASRIELATSVLSRISCNSFHATLPDATPVGLAFDPEIALVNHSCAPNAHVIFEGRSMILQSLIPIQKGQELFISYVDVQQECNSRRQDLWRTYFFWCRCPKCTKEAGIETWAKAC